MGEYCTLEIDATNGPARILVDESSFLGIDPEDDGVDITIGELYTFKSGVNRVRIYNGAEYGSLSILLAYTLAIKLAGVLPLAALVMTTL